MCATWLVMASRSCERTRKVNLKLPLHPQISTCHKYSPTCTALKSKQRVVPSSWQRVMTLSFNSQQVKVEEQLFFDTTKTWTGVLVVGGGGSDQCQRAVFAPAAPSSARAAWGHFFSAIPSASKRSRSSCLSPAAQSFWNSHRFTF